MTRQGRGRQVRQAPGWIGRGGAWTASESPSPFPFSRLQPTPMLPVSGAMSPDLSSGMTASA